MDTGLLVAATGLIFAGVVKGAVGFGLPMIAAPVLTGFIGPRPAVVVMSLVNFASAALVVARTGWVPLRPYAGSLGPMALLTWIGVVVGAQLLAWLNPTLLSVVVGLVAMLFGLLSAARVEPYLPPERSGLVGAVVGLGAGLLAGVTSVSATPIVMYFHALKLPKRDFLLLLNLFLACTSLVQIASYATLGLYTNQVLESSVLTVACVALGVGLGFIVQERINQRLFNRAVVGDIFLVGLSLVVRAIAR